MNEKVLPIYFYHTPSGRQELIACTSVNPEDHDYFLNNDIKVSMEEQNGSIIVYGCPESDESEESEVLIIKQGRPMIEILAELAKECKQVFGDRAV
jgi:hypothetical protein